MLSGLSKLQRRGKILSEKHGEIWEGYTVPNLFPITSEVSRLIFFSWYLTQLTATELREWESRVEGEPIPDNGAMERR